MSHLLPTALKESRCILHIDLDCFYCQVEQVRLGIPFDTPAAVQQWQGLIAVNYAARKAGVQRHANVTEAKELCPDIQLLHVATYGPQDTEPQYYKDPDRRTHKVCLDPYRNASREIFKIFNQHCDTIQKIGTDEGFMDVTKIVNQRLMDRYTSQCIERIDDEECGVDIQWKGILLTSKEEDETQETSVATWKDLQLAMGAELASEIRTQIFEELNYTCSAGIAHYKVVAKLCSSKNKPNKQTILRETARMDFMYDIPFKKIRNLGGKLGSEVGTDLEVLNSNELWKYSKQDLQTKYGQSTGLYLYHICRGIDHEEVNSTKAPKSLMASKRFNPYISTLNEMETWFSILSVELHSRIQQNYKDHGTWPKNIAIRYTSRYGQKTKSMGTLHKDDMQTCDNLLKKFRKAFNALQDAYPCSGLELMASGLTLPQSVQSLNSFFKKIPIEGESSSSKKQNTPTIESIIHQDAPVIQQDTSIIQQDTWECDKCRQKVPIKDIEEHTDYHFALEISEQDIPKRKSTSTHIAPFFTKRQK